MRPDRKMKERQKLAKHVERAAVPERPFILGLPRYFIQPSVTEACAPSLRAIAAALRDETQPIDDASLEAVRSWLTNGDGPFFGRDTTAALREVVRIECGIAGASTAFVDEEPVSAAV